MQKIRRIPLRSTFMTSFQRCPRKAYLDVMASGHTIAKLPHYMLGGAVVAQLFDLHFRGAPLPSDDMTSAITVFNIVAETGEYSYTEDQRNAIIQRTAEAFKNFKVWWNGSGFEIIASEVEIRYCDDIVDLAIKIDIIAKRVAELYFLDIKSHGMWGKSVSPPKFSEEQMKRNMQVSFYASAVRDGCRAYVNQDIPREMPSLEVEKEFKGFDLGELRPDYIGFVEIAYLTEYKRGSKDGSKAAGDVRGDPLIYTEYTDARAEYAEEVIRYTNMAILFNQFPKFERYERGQSTCDSCIFKVTCWSEQVNTKAEMPEWMA